MPTRLELTVHRSARVQKAPDKSHPSEKEPQKRRAKSISDAFAAKGSQKVIYCVNVTLEVEDEDDDATYWMSHSEASQKGGRERYPWENYSKQSLYQRWVKSWDACTGLREQAKERDSTVTSF